jgi:hypothetical protein
VFGRKEELPIMPNVERQLSISDPMIAWPEMETLAAQQTRPIGRQIPSTWLTRAVCIHLAAGRARAMLAAARREHVNLGGRFSVRGTGKVVVIWSQVTRAGSRPAPIGGFSLERRRGDEPGMVITQIGWDPTVSAAEADVCAAVEHLGRAPPVAKTPSVRPAEGRPGHRPRSTRYTTRFKQDAIAQVISGQKSASAVCRAIGIDARTLRRWRSEYGADGR